MPDSSLLQRLKERKLVQWSLAYLAGAFVVVQLLDAVAEPVGLSSARHLGILAVLVVGFFITLVLAWYHGEKGRQRVSGPELLMVAALLVVAGALVSMLPGRRDEEGPVEPASIADVEGDRPSIAVLPFDDFSPDPNDAYFANGMQEQLVLTLSKIRSLSVKGRTSAMRYRDDPKPLPEVSRELGVSFVLEGSARLAGGQVSVTAQLVDAVRDEHLWAEEYDRDFSIENVISIQRDIAQHVTETVGTVLTPGDQARIEARPTESQDAYQEYLRGRYEWNRRSEAGLTSAILHFQAALNEDPTYALAMSGLADSYVILGEYSPAAMANPVPSQDSARHYAQEAIKANPEIVESHASLAMTRLYAWDWDGAFESFRRAISIDPQYPTAHHWFGIALVLQGEHEEGIAELRKAVDMEPLSFVMVSDLAVGLARAGRYEEAFEHWAWVSDLEPHFAPPHCIGTFFLVHLGRSDEAIQRARRCAELQGLDVDLFSDLVGNAARFASTREPAELPEDLAGASLMGQYGDVALSVMSGQRERAIDLLEQAFRARAWWLITLRDPWWDFIRDDPRVQEILDAVGLSQ